MCGFGQAHHVESLNRVTQSTLVQSGVSLTRHWRSRSGMHGWPLPLTPAPAAGTKGESPSIMHQLRHCRYQVCADILMIHPIVPRKTINTSSGALPCPFYFYQSSQLQLLPCCRIYKTPLHLSRGAPTRLLIRSLHSAAPYDTRLSPRLKGQSRPAWFNDTTRVLQISNQ